MTPRLAYLSPWQSGDETAFEPRPDMAAERAFVGWDWTEGPPGPTWAVIAWTRQGWQRVGVAGFVRAGDGWQAWAQLAALPRRLWPDLARLAAARLEAVAGPIEASARIDIPCALRLLERLGFRATGERFGDYVYLERAA